jgi:hypothetical protein
MSRRWLDMRMRHRDLREQCMLGKAQAVQRLRHNPLEESKEFAGDQANLRQDWCQVFFLLSSS